MKNSLMILATLLISSTSVLASIYQPTKVISNPEEVSVLLDSLRADTRSGIVLTGGIVYQEHQFNSSDVKAIKVTHKGPHCEAKILFKDPKFYSYMFYFVDILGYDKVALATKLSQECRDLIEVDNFGSSTVQVDSSASVEDSSRDHIKEEATQLKKEEHSRAISQ